MGPGQGGSAAGSKPPFIPSFFIIGPPRTGTTWLHDVLSKHALLPSPSKETRFFDTHFHRGLEWYRAHFARPAGNRPVGEIAPTYFASPDARERIAATAPDARIVCIFRNPVDRIVSLYRIKRAYGMIPWSFEQAIVRDPELIASGLYATHLKAWFNTLGSERVLPTVYEDLRDRPQAFVDTITQFIGIPPFVLTPSQIRRVHGSESMTLPRSYYRARTANAVADWFKAQRLDRVVATLKNSPIRRFILGGGQAFADIPEDLSTALCDIFRPEVEELEVLLNRDFTAWKTADFAVRALAAS